MSRLLASSAAIALLSTAALAADLPLPMEPIEDVVVAPAYSWTGFYIGGQAGYGWGDVEFDWEIPPLAATQRLGTDPEGFLGGGFAGAQFQWNSFVAGLEVSYSAGELDGGDNNVVFVGAFDRRFESEIDSLFTAAARVGLAADRWLIYGKGGYATAEVDLRTVRQVDGLLQTTSSEREHGFLVGAGVERALGSFFVLGAEYNYINLLADDRTGVNVPPTIDSNHRDIDVGIHTIMGRGSIKFGGGTP